MVYKTFLLALMLILTALHQSSTAKPEQKIRFHCTRLKFVRTIASFGRRLMRQLVLGQTHGNATTGNVIISPLGISTVLATMRLGASGETRREIDTACGFQENVNENFKSLRQSALVPSGQTSKVITANGLFYDKPVKLVTEFENIANDYYETETKAVDFHTTPETARKEINEWVNNRTEGMITQILLQKDVPKTTQLVITNTLFFNGSWDSGFDPKLTRSRTFQVSKKKKIEIPMMRQKNHFNFRLPYRNPKLLPLSPQPNVIEIPYVGGRHTMILLVSNEHISLEEIEENLPTKYFQWRRHLNKDKLTLSMPKFQMDYQTDLILPLREMGIKKAFQKNTANFQSMTHDRISFSKFLHRSKLIVDEFGTQAASSSALLGVLRMVESKLSIKFDVDRPFVFVIEDKKTGVQLFTGRITDPSWLP